MESEAGGRTELGYVTVPPRDMGLLGKRTRQTNVNVRNKDGFFLLGGNVSRWSSFFCSIYRRFLSGGQLGGFASMPVRAVLTKTARQASLSLFAPPRLSDSLYSRWIVSEGVYDLTRAMEWTRVASVFFTLGAKGAGRDSCTLGANCSRTG